jgi:hypothetical protein
MKSLLILAAASLLSVGFAQSDAETRLAELERYVVTLEQRIAALEARLSVAGPPAEIWEVDGFTFTRVGVAQRTSFAEIVGEVTADRAYARVQVRFTMYSSDGAIIGAETTYVDNVGSTPRTFDLLVRGVTVDDVASIRIQIESSR